MQRILISACLLGRRVRYDGNHKAVTDSRLDRWRREGRLVPICPELAAGFGTPRPPAEIVGPGDGIRVLRGQATVQEHSGDDVTSAFLAGAREALDLARQHGIAHAILADGSPSCGSHRIYDGSFGGKTKPGMGVTAALLQRHGIAVFSESEIPLLAAELEAGTRSATSR